MELDAPQQARKRRRVVIKPIARAAQRQNKRINVKRVDRPVVVEISTSSF
jgi:hypothetical protein